MKYQYIRNLCFLIIFIISMSCSAKNNYKVVIDTIEFKELTDITARTQPEYDKDNNPCALIKVYAPLMENLRFRGDAIVKETKNDNGIWLWVKDRCADITIEAKDMEPKIIVWSDYGYSRLHAKTTYQLNITVGHEREVVVYKDVYKYNVVDKTKFEEDEDKLLWFLMYQYQPESPFGLNIGACKKLGFYISYNYYQFDESWRLSTFRGGMMFRLTNFLYIQPGGGFSYDHEDRDIYFTGGMNFLFCIKRFVIGCGYNYNYMSVDCGRNIILDGITAQIGLNF